MAEEGLAIFTLVIPLYIPTAHAPPIIAEITEVKIVVFRPLILFLFE